MSETQVIAFLLILTRVSVFVGFFTLFSFRQLPNMVKVGIATSLSVFWYGELYAHAEVLADVDLGVIDGSLWFAREFVIGMMLSVALNLFFMPCKIAGAYIGQEMGLSLAAISSPGTPDSGTLITRIFESFSILAFFALDFHHFLLLTIDYSFKRIDDRIDVLNLPTKQLTTMLNVTSDYGLMIVGPIAIILAIVTVGLAILNRVAPSLNLFSVGLSVRTGFGILCLAVLIPVIFEGIEGYLTRVQGDIEQLLALFRYG